MTLHKEGTASLLIGAIALFAINGILSFFLPDATLIHTFALIISLVLYAIVVQFFRKPKRFPPLHEGHLLAPADGKVVVIEEVFEPEYFKGPRKQVSIFMSPFNVHINFNPLSGIVSYFKYHPGKYLVAWHPKASTENERTTVVVKHANGNEILFRQIAGALAKRICWYVKEGDLVKQGEEFGFIKFGSRVDIYLPLDAEITVKLGDKPVGGETVIAKFRS